MEELNLKERSPEAQLLARYLKRDCRKAVKDSALVTGLFLGLAVLIACYSFYALLLGTLLENILDAGVAGSWLSILLTHLLALGSLALLFSSLRRDGVEFSGHVQYLRELLLARGTLLNMLEEDPRDDRAGEPGGPLPRLRLGSSQLLPRVRRLVRDLPRQSRGSKQSFYPGSDGGAWRNWIQAGWAGPLLVAIAPLLVMAVYSMGYFGDGGVEALLLLAFTIPLCLLPLLALRRYRRLQDEAAVRAALAEILFGDSGRGLPVTETGRA